MIEVVVKTGAISRTKLQSNCHHQQTNTQCFTGWMLFVPTNSVRALKGILPFLPCAMKKRQSVKTKMQILLLSSVMFHLKSQQWSRKEHLWFVGAEFSLARCVSVSMWSTKSITAHKDRQATPTTTSLLHAGVKWPISIQCPFKCNMPDYHQNQMVSSMAHVPPFHQMCENQLLSV